MTAGFRIERLGGHDRAEFSCGVAVLDRYLREQASQDVKRLMASCFVAVDGTTDRLAGYYTLAAASVPATELPHDVLKRLPRYPVLPAALLGRLAIDTRFHRRGLGSALLADAALRVIESDTNAFALIVDAIDDAAVAFYAFQGFRPFASRPMSLYLPLGTFQKAAAKDSSAM